LFTWRQSVIVLTVLTGLWREVFYFGVALDGGLFKFFSWLGQVFGLSDCLAAWDLFWMLLVA
jgi:hypothetical protein